jgi:hypothetical protein
MTHVKSIVFRYIMTYYNRERIYTGIRAVSLPLCTGRPPGAWLLKNHNFGCSGSARFLTSPKENRLCTAYCYAWAAQGLSSCCAVCLREPLI